MYLACKKKWHPLKKKRKKPNLLYLVVRDVLICSYVYSGKLSVVKFALSDYEPSFIMAAWQLLNCKCFQMQPQRVSLLLYIFMPISINVLKPCWLSISWPWQQQMTRCYFSREWHDSSARDCLDWLYLFVTLAHLSLSLFSFFFHF